MDFFLATVFTTSHAMLRFYTFERKMVTVSHHRIGRTGRIGNYGKAYSFATPEDSRALWRIKKLRESQKA
jgi:superfamily II DNA/RNA helicase